MGHLKRTPSQCILGRYATCDTMLSVRWNVLVPCKANFSFVQPTNLPMNSSVSRGGFSKSGISIMATSYPAQPHDFAFTFWTTQLHYSSLAWENSFFLPEWIFTEAMIHKHMIIRPQNERVKSRLEFQAPLNSYMCAFICLQSFVLNRRNLVR